MRAFAPHVPAQTMSGLVPEVSEWEALKSFLPERRFYSEEEILVARHEVQRMARQVLKDSDPERISK